MHCKDHGVRLISEVHRDRTKSNWLTLKCRRYPVNSNKHFFFFFFTVRVTEHWDRLQILEIFKSCLDMGQGKVLEVTMPEQEVEQDNLQQTPPASSNPQFCKLLSLFRLTQDCLPMSQDSISVSPNSSCPASVMLQQSCSPASHSPVHDPADSGHLWVHVLGQTQPIPVSRLPWCAWLTCWGSGPSWGASTSAGLQGGNCRSVPNNSCH